MDNFCHCSWPRPLLGHGGAHAQNDLREVFEQINTVRVPVKACPTERPRCWGVEGVEGLWKRLAAFRVFRKLWKCARGMGRRGGSGGFWKCAGFVWRVAEGLFWDGAHNFSSGAVRKRSWRVNKVFLAWVQRFFADVRNFFEVSRDVHGFWESVQVFVNGVCRASLKWAWKVYRGIFGYAKVLFGE